MSVLRGDCVEVMAGMEPNSVDAIVCDPPYGLEFMGKDWDALDTPAWRAGHGGSGPASQTNGVPFGGGGKRVRYGTGNQQEWHERWAREAYRILKPGGHLLAFGGSRTYHRLAAGIEDAGFEIRDQLMWVYASGFPKSHDVSKAIDKKRDDLEEHGRVARWLVERMQERSVTRKDVNEHFGYANAAQQWTTHWTDKAVKPRVPTWEQWQELQRWLGFGPEMDAEVWRLNGRKGQPGEAWFEREVIEERLMVQGGGNALELRMGERREVRANITAPATDAAREWSGWGTALKPAHEPIVMARKPLIGTVAQNVQEHGTGALNIDGCRIGTSGATKRGDGGGRLSPQGAFTTGHDVVTVDAGRWPANVILTDPVFDGGWDGVVGGGDAPSTGNGKQPTPAREGWRGDSIFGAEQQGRLYGDTGTYSRFFLVPKAPSRERTLTDGRRSPHPTQKPEALIRHLVTMVTPPGGIVLDPFLGSGTLGVVCEALGVRWLGIEREDEYADWAEDRIADRKAKWEVTA